jgi:hypothetical protein
MYINKIKKNTMKNTEKNKYNISKALLKSLYVSKKDYNKVYTIKYENNLRIPVYKEIDKKYTFKHSLIPFTTYKQFFSTDGFSSNSRSSSIYNNNLYRTKTIDSFISKVSQEDKQI